MQFREEAMAAERERQSRLNAKSLNIEEVSFTMTIDPTMYETVATFKAVNCLCWIASFVWFGEVYN